MSFTSPVRVALIGGGDHGLRSVLAAASMLAGWRVAAIVDPDPAARARAHDAVSGVRTAESVGVLCDEGLASGDVDLVVVATPPAATADVLRDVMERPAFAPATVLIEKPGARSADELRGLIPASSARPTPVRVAFSYRQHRTVQEFRAATRALGTLQSLSLAFHAPAEVRGWRASVASGGGALRDLGAHLLDLAALLVPEPWELQSAVFASHRTEHDDVRLRYLAAGTRIDVHVSYRGTPTFSLDAAGAGGHVSGDLWRRTTPSTSRAGALWARALTAAVPSRNPGALLRASYADTMRLAPTEGATLHDAAMVLQRIAEAEQVGHA